MRFVILFCAISTKIHLFQECFCEFYLLRQIQYLNLQFLPPVQIIPCSQLSGQHPVSHQCSTTKCRVAAGHGTICKFLRKQSDGCSCLRIQVIAKASCQHYLRNIRKSDSIAFRQDLYACGNGSLRQLYRTHGFFRDKYISDTDPLRKIGFL